jgi:predicted metalloprotease with PDZ domain
MRKLWVQFGRTGVGVPEDGVERLLELVGGSDVAPLVHRALHTGDELPMAEALASHGLELTWRVPRGLDDAGGPGPAAPPLRCDVGLELRAEGPRVRIASVRRGSPAEEAGLCPGDELVAIDGLRADPATARERLHDRAPRTRAELVLFRRDELTTATLVAVEPLSDTAQVTQMPGAPEGTVTLLTRWLGP